jgi:hypothetical protein
LSPDPRGAASARTRRASTRWRRFAAAALLGLASIAGCAPAPSPPPATAGPAPTADPSVPASPTPTPTPTPTPSARRTPIKVSIFGDSQASALYFTRPRTVSRYLQLTDDSISACGILRGQVVSRSGERFDLIGACPNWLSKWRSDAKRDHPAIALVMIGAWDVFDLRTTKGTLTFATAEWDANFLAALRSGVDALRESGAQVALAELPCYRPHSTNPRPPGWWPERGDDARTRHVNDLLRQVADGVHVFTITPAAAFCTDPKIADNHKYRYDGVHYLQPGATLYLDAIIPQLVTLPA